jgi:hypothetical protein
MAEPSISHGGNLSQSRLRDILHYDPLTGVFTWRIALSKRTPIGSVAGNRGKAGYVYIRIAGSNYAAHRLAWIYMTGEWPPLEVDHVDGSRDKNEWDNLRLASSSQNNANRRTPLSKEHGLKGVRFNDGRWEARIQIKGSRVSLGRFSSAQEAQDAYRSAALEHFGPYAYSP